MKKYILTGLIGFMVGAFTFAPTFKSAKNCELCGEVYDSSTSAIEQMCDMCYGWNEHKATTKGMDYQVNFEDGTSYTFEFYDN